MADLKPDIRTEFTINEGKPLDLGSIGGLCGPKLPYRGPLKICAPDGTTVTFDDVLITETVDIGGDVVSAADIDLFNPIMIDGGY